MTEKDFIKKCLICGDRAISNNFDALSCESCKAFFRRNAVKNKEFKCHFDNSCKIDIFSRKFCKKCRLDKCFAIGMKKDWILNEDEKKERKSRIENNRKKRKNSKSYKVIDSTTATSPESLSSDSMISDKSQELSSDTNTTLEIPETFGELDIDIDEIESQILEIEKYIKDEETNEISDIVYDKAAELEFSIIPIARPISDYNNTFNELESNKLMELFNATNILKTTLSKITSQAMSVTDVCRVMCIKMESDVKKIIKMSKNLTSFNGIGVNDQISLIKYGSLELFSLRSINSYVQQNEYWTLVLDEDNSVILKLELMKECPRNIYEAYKNFLGKFGREWDSDSVILDLLTAIVLFNPERPELIEREIIKLQQHMYMHLLKRYLILKYQSENQSKLKFLRLLNTLIDLNILGQKHLKNCSEKDPEAIPPLLREIVVDMKTNGIESKINQKIEVF